MLNRNSFIYTGERCEFTDAAGYLKIQDMRCKHVCRLESFKAQELLRASRDIGYDQCLWGYGENYGNDPELNRIVQLSRIQRFIYDGFVHPIRIVADDKNVLWIDNMHSAVAQAVSRGEGCTLAEVPYFIVARDQGTGYTQIYDPHKLVDLNRAYGMLTVADIRLTRVSDNVRRVGYTVGDFMKENEFDKEHMTIGFEHYDNFNDLTDKMVDKMVLK